MFRVSNGRCLRCISFSAPLRMQLQSRSIAVLLQPIQEKKGSRSCAKKRLAVKDVTHRSTGVCRAAKGAQGTSNTPAVGEVEVEGGDLKISAERLPGSTMKVTIVVPQKQVAKAWSQAIKHFAKKINVPENLVVQQVGKEKIMKEAFNVLCMSTVPKAMEAYGDMTYEDSLSIEDWDTLSARFSVDKSFSYSCYIAVYPEVRWKGDYRNMKVEIDAAVDDDEIRKSVQKKIWASLKDKGSLRVVNHRGVEMGDVAVVNFVAMRAETGKEISGSRQVKMHLDTVEGEDMMGLESVASDIQGMTVGETKTFDKTIEDVWFEPNGEDTDIVYEITILEILSRDLPEMTDELAQQLYSKCTGAEDLYRQMEEAERMQANYHIIDRMRQTIRQRLTDLVDVDVPEFAFRQTASTEYQAQLLTIQAEGRLTKQQVEELATEPMLEIFMNSRREDIMQIAKSTFGMAKVLEEQQLEVSEEAITAEMECAQQEFRQEGTELDADRLREQVIEGLEGGVVLKWLISHADITYAGNPELDRSLKDLKNGEMSDDMARMDLNGVN